MNVASSQNVLLEVYDTQGRRSAILYDGYVEGGVEYDFIIDAKNYNDGIYIVRLLTELGKLKTHKMMIIN